VTKAELRAYVDRIKDDEPVFLVRAQDVLAANFVHGWAVLAYECGVNAGKVNEAFKCADAMRSWHGPKKLPD
jgi:hypothetical protein